MVTVAREGGAAEQESSRACRIREQTGINGSSRGDAVGDTQPAGHQRESERKQRQRWLQFIGNKLAECWSDPLTESGFPRLERCRGSNWKQRRGSKCILADFPREASWQQTNDRDSGEK